jgi:hypothetical protein
MRIKAYAWDSRDSILAFGNPGFASDEHRAVQARNRKTGAAMPLIKKVDVKNYLATRRQRAHRRFLTSVPDATGTSETDMGSTEPDIQKSEPPVFAEDFFAEHSSIPKSEPSANHSDSLSAPATSKSARA